MSSLDVLDCNLHGGEFPGNCSSANHLGKIGYVLYAARSEQNKNSTIAKKRLSALPLMILKYEICPNLAHKLRDLSQEKFTRDSQTLLFALPSPSTYGDSNLEDLSIKCREVAIEYFVNDRSLAKEKQALIQANFSRITNSGSSGGELYATHAVSIEERLRIALYNKTFL